MVRPRADGLYNVITGLNDPDVDTRQHTERQYRGPRSTWELEAEWQQSWLAAAEIDQMPADMYRSGFDILDVNPPLDMSKMRSYIEGDLRIRWDGTLDNRPSLSSIAWQFTHTGDKLGGSALYPIMADGLDPREPLDLRRVDRVIGWEVFGRDEITPGYYSSSLEPEFYILSDVLGGNFDLRPGDVIHRSRLLIHPGLPLSRRETRNRQGWGASLLERNWELRRAVEESLQYLLTYIDRASWLHCSIAQLTEMLAKEDDDGNNVGEDDVRRMLRTMRYCARTLGMVATDAGRAEGEIAADGKPIPARPGDKLESITESSGDLSKINAATIDHWVYALQRPRTIALGEGTNGLRGGDNDGDQQKWAGDVQHRWNIVGVPALNFMLIHEFAAKRGPTNGVVPKSWTLSRRPLRVQTAIEQAKEREAIIAGDILLKKEGVVTNDEIRQQRLVNGDYAGPLKVQGKLAQEISRDPLTVGLIDAIVQMLLAIAKNELPVDAFAPAAAMISEGRVDIEKARGLAATLREGLAGLRGTAVPTSIDTPALTAAVPAADGVLPTEPSADEPEAPEPFSTDPRPTDLMTPGSRR
jgi:hypothetical protein